MTQLIELRRKPHLSISQIKTYLQCPRRYFLQYIHRIPPAFRPVALPFGSAWHEAVGTWLANSMVGDEIGRDVTKHVFGKQLEQDLDEDEIPVLFDGDDDNIERTVAQGHRMLDAFFDAVPLPEHVLGVEVPFSFSLVDPVTGEVLPVPLIGAVDAIVEENGKPVVWEIKTAARRWSADQLDFDPQSTGYQMAMREQHGVEAAVQLIATTKSATPTVQIEPMLRTRADENELVATAASVLRAVDAGVDHQVRGWQCRNCGWAAECEA